MRNKKLVPFKTFKQLKTLYQHDTSPAISRDKLDNYHLFSNRNGLWDAYYFSDFIFTKGYSYADVGCPDEEYPPECILVKRSRTSFKYLFFDTELEIILNSGLSNIDVFKEVSPKWIKKHQSARSKKNQKH